MHSASRCLTLALLLPLALLLLGGLGLAVWLGWHSASGALLDSNVTQVAHASPANPAALVSAPAGITDTPTPTRTPTPCGLMWRVVTSPNPGSSEDFSLGVAAVAPNDVWAVGIYTDNPIGRTLTMHWNGTAWTHIPSPNVGTADGFAGAAAISSNDVCAVGNTNTATVYAQTLTEHCDGTHWSVIPSPNRGPSDTIRRK